MQLNPQQSGQVPLSLTTRSTDPSHVNFSNAIAKIDPVELTGIYGLTVGQVGLVRSGFQSPQGAAQTINDLIKHYFSGEDLEKAKIHVKGVLLTCKFASPDEGMRTAADNILTEFRKIENTKR